MDTPADIGPSFEFLSAINVSTVFSILFALIFIWWFLFTLISIYHWLRHASDSWIAVPAVALHLFVSGWLIFYATSGLH
jgi:hypothetical protein